MLPYNRKPIPKSVLIFGASGRIGGPLARFLTTTAPDITLRLSTSSEAKAEDLRRKFPRAEVVIADYREPGTLAEAVRGMEGVFCLTTSGTPEDISMGNLIHALKADGSVIHVIRLLGLTPEANPHHVPALMRERQIGLPIQHRIAQKLFLESGLPVTYLNAGATFMSTLLWMRDAIRTRHELIWPERLVPYIDTDEIGEVAGRLFLSDNHRHIGQFHTMNNGHDILRFHEVAAMMSQVWGETITYDGSKDSFYREYAAMGTQRLDTLWTFFMYEQDNEVAWSRNDFVETMLGRKPKILKDWLAENKAAFFAP